MPVAGLLVKAVDDGLRVVGSRKHTAIWLGFDRDAVRKQSCCLVVASGEHRVIHVRLLGSGRSVRWVQSIYV